MGRLKAINQTYGINERKRLSVDVWIFNLFILIHSENVWGIKSRVLKLLCFLEYCIPFSLIFNIRTLNKQLIRHVPFFIIDLIHSSYQESGDWVINYATCIMKVTNEPANQCFLNFYVHMDHLGSWLQCKFSLVLLGCGLRICIPSKLTHDGPEAGPLTTISKAFSVMNSSVQACLHSVVGSYSAGKRISSFEAETK